MGEFWYYAIVYGKFKCLGYEKLNEEEELERAREERKERRLRRLRLLWAQEEERQYQRVLSWRALHFILPNYQDANQRINETFRRGPDGTRMSVVWRNSNGNLRRVGSEFCLVEREMDTWTGNCTSRCFK